jgi:alpha-L-fucosidase
LHADSWAELFADACARYVVLTTKHMDGYTLWPPSYRNPRDGWHATRDLVGDITSAVRARGMKMGLYYSGGFDATFNGTVIDGLLAGARAIPQSEAYASYCDAHVRELIDRYRPDVLWNDIAYPARGKVKEIIAHYYNTVPDGVVNDRWMQLRLSGGVGSALVTAVVRALEVAWPLLPKSWKEFRVTGSRHADFSTAEYASFDEPRERKWEAVRGIGLSFGNNREEGEREIIQLDELVALLVDVVSKNGNLLLGVGAEPDGTVPAAQRKRLLELGTWLATNGEAIFDTRPWSRAGAQTADGTDVRFTRTGDALYAIVLGTPTMRELRIDGLSVADGAEAELLGREGTLPHRNDGGQLVIDLPEQMPGSPAFALRIRPRPA